MAFGPEVAATRDDRVGTADRQTYAARQPLQRITAAARHARRVGKLPSADIREALDKE